MNIVKNITQNKWTGGNRMEVIVIHWWNDPAQKPTMEGVVSWFLNPKSQVSAHYVVSGDKVIQMADETDMTWHAMQANSFAIGIEIDPNVPGNTYKTVGELVKQIRSRRGNLPLKRHSEYVNTTCPGNIDLDRIEIESKGDTMTPEEAKAIAEGYLIPMRVLNSEAKGWNFTKVHKGEYDAREIAYMTQLVLKHGAVGAMTAYAQQAHDEGAAHRKDKAAWQKAVKTLADVQKQLPFEEVKDKLYRRK